MAYGRYETRGQWREPRYRRNETPGRGDWAGSDDGRRDRGFFERAGDEISSWFGDDDASRRRDSDDRDDERGYAGYRSQRPRAFMGDSDFGSYGSYERFPRGDRRPYSGRGDYGATSFARDDRFDDQRPFGESRWDRGQTQADQRSAAGLYDRDYSRWRQSQIDSFDRDYDEFRRENSQRFEQEFSTWRTERTTKRQLLSQVAEHMTVVGSDGEDVGEVDKVRGDRVILTKASSDDGQHHALGCRMIDRIEDERLYLNVTAEEARTHLRDELRGRALNEPADQGQDGPMVLERSFSGTYR